METFKLKKGQQKDTIVTGTGVHVTKIITGDKALTGYFSAVADAAGGNLTRRLWFSLTPGGEPLDQTYKGGNAADTGHRETCKLSFTTGRLVNPTQCLLQQNATYYLNAEQKGFGDSTGPTATSAFVRGYSARVQG